MDEIPTDIDSSYTRKFISDIRTQFSLIADSDSLGRLFDEISYYTINIDAYQILGNNHDENLLKFVVGNESHESQRDLDCTKLILDKFHLNYALRKVLRIEPPYYSPGVLLEVYSSLNKSVSIYSLYISASNALYADTNSLSKSLNIIDHLK